MSNPAVSVNSIPYRLRPDPDDKVEIVADAVSDLDEAPLPVDSWLRPLALGDEVWWTDPHCGISSGIYKIARIDDERGVVGYADTILLLKNDEGSEVEAFASELSPSQPEDLYPVIDGDDGNGNIYGYAKTRDDAIEVGNATFADEVVDGYLAENVTLCDGSIVAKAWVALTFPLTTRLRLTFDIDYALNGEPLADMIERLRRMAERAVGNGMLTGDSPAEVEQYSMSVTEVPALLDEDEVAEFLRQRIEDGLVDADDLPVRMARYGLQEVPDFIAEMRERMDNAANED